MTKNTLRERLRTERRAHVEALPDATRALLFLRPPAPLLDLVPQDAIIGLYRAMPMEAPAASYARFFQERGHPVALPRFASRAAPMEFAPFNDPHGESDLQIGPFGLMQPGTDAASIVPQVLIMPLIGFTAIGHRLGQGGGHYDRWLANHPGTITIGLGWDVQLVDHIPTEVHDMALNAIVTPTRLYGPY